MFALLTTALFVAVALLAAGSIAGTLRRYGPMALAAKRALDDCPPQREVRYSIREVGGLPPQGQVVTLPVRRRPAVQQGLRAAA